MHVSYGLSNYPQYFQKWPAPQLDEAIESLEKQLREAKIARSRLEDRKSYVEAYEPLHPWLREPKAEDIFVEAVVNFLKESSLDSSGARELLAATQEIPGVFSFDLLKPEVCNSLQEEFAHYVRYRDAYVQAHDGESPPGTLRERLQLADCGLSGFENFAFETLAKPLCRVLFGTSQDTGVADIDAVHGYTVGYGPSESKDRNVTREALVPHVDDAEITLNVCLSDQFQGGALTFHGKRTPQTVLAYDLPKPHEHDYTHTLGRAIIHLGNHMHEVKPVTSGERHVLIFWFRSWRNYRANHCPCCLKFRRKACICSPEWN